MKLTVSIEDSQIKICEQYGVTYQSSLSDMKVGIALDSISERSPINGLRHAPEGDTTGWYIWGGEEPGVEADYFKPLHVEHLLEYCPAILKYLGLPSGWRFLIAEGYEDVWYDETLLAV
jgi:hypothetical protein